MHDDSNDKNGIPYAFGTIKIIFDHIKLLAA